MDWLDLEKHFSAARLGRYRAACDGDEIRAARAYVSNMLVAEAMMPMLNVLEIALKNGIHQRMTALYKRTNWWEAWENDPVFVRQISEVANAKIKLQRRAEELTSDKIIAELAFGFWSSLFNVQFQTVLWKDLRLVFLAAQNLNANVIRSHPRSTRSGNCAIGFSIMSNCFGSRLPSSICTLKASRSSAGLTTGFHPGWPVGIVFRPRGLRFNRSE